MGDGLEAVDLDLGDYCRRVEEHLTRANEGHLVRIAGTGFDRVRQWAIDGIPLSVVCRGIDLKAERHRTGRSKRPLRIEFCEGDVRDVYEQWRRAVGVAAVASGPGAADPEPAPEERRRPSLARELDRIIEKLVRASGRLDTPGPLRDAIATALEAVATIRDEAHGARGERRAMFVAQIAAVDAALITAARSSAAPDLLDEVRAAAMRDLAVYRGRMPAEVWDRSVEAGMDALLRERCGLPTVDLE